MALQEVLEAEMMEVLGAEKANGPRAGRVTGRAITAAQGPKLSSGNAWTGISLPVYHDPVPAHSANPSFQGPRPQGTNQRGFLDLPFDPEAAKIKPHYEWQYHYAGRHAYWEGHWVLVTAPIQSAKAPTAN